MRFIEAAHYGSERTHPINLIVIHTMEWAERNNTAEDCAAWFQNPASTGSAHYCVDNNSVVQCVRDENEAWGAPGVNYRAIHIEHAGYASQTRVYWTDKYSTEMLCRSAQLAAGLCSRYSIQAKHLSNSELSNGLSGFVGHNQCTEVFETPGGHTDPGCNFPWDIYIDLVLGYLRLQNKPIKEKSDNMVVFISPVGHEPGDGIYAVTEQGVYPVTHNRWVILETAGATHKQIPRDQYNALLTEVEYDV